MIMLNCQVILSLSSNYSVYFKAENLFIKSMAVENLIKRKVKLSIFQGSAATFHVLHGGFTSLYQLHGICLLKAIKDDYQFIGQHPMLKWRPISIRGNFINGTLQGPAILGTDRANLIYVNFVNGVIHGPVFAYGNSLIYFDDYQVTIVSWMGVMGNYCVV